MAIKDLREKYDLTQINEMLKEVKQKLAELDPSRQHGRAGKECDDPYQEYTRLKNNYDSRVSRAKKKALEKQQDKTFNEIYGINTDEDEYGIRPVDERRYKRCFHSGYIGAPVYRDYVKRMTGLSLKQIAILQKRTGLIPVPAVEDAEADADEKRRWETGDIY